MHSICVVCETLIWLAALGNQLSNTQWMLLRRWPWWKVHLDSFLFHTIGKNQWSKGSMPLSGTRLSVSICLSVSQYITFKNIFSEFVVRAMEWKTTRIKVACRLCLRLKAAPAYISFNNTWTVKDKEGCIVIAAKCLDNSPIYFLMPWTLEQILLHDISQTPTAGLQLLNTFISTYLQFSLFFLLLFFSLFEGNCSILFMGDKF